MPFDSDEQRRAFFGKFGDGPAPGGRKRTMRDLKNKRSGTAALKRGDTKTAQELVEQARARGQETTEQRIRRLSAVTEQTLARLDAQRAEIIRKNPKARIEQVEDAIERRAARAYAQKQAGMSKRALRQIKSAESWMRTK